MEFEKIEAEFIAATSSEQENQQSKRFDRFFEGSGDPALENLFKNMGGRENQNALLAKILASSLDKETKSNFIKRLKQAGSHVLEIITIETEFNAAVSSKCHKKQRESAEAFPDRFSKFMDKNRKLGIPPESEEKQPGLATMIMALLRKFGEKEDADSKTRDGYHFAIKPFRPLINLAPMMAKHIARDLVPIVNAFLVAKNEINANEDIKRTLEVRSKIKAEHCLMVMQAYEEAGFTEEQAFALLISANAEKKTQKK
jgi:hypothetical protein